MIVVFTPPFCKIRKFQQMLRASPCYGVWKHGNGVPHKCAGFNFEDDRVILLFM